MTGDNVGNTTLLSMDGQKVKYNTLAGMEHGFCDSRCLEGKHKPMSHIHHLCLWPLQCKYITNQ